MDGITFENIWSIEQNQFSSMISVIEGLNGAELLASLTDDAQRAGIDVQRVENVAVIPVRGVISKSPTLFSMIFGGSSLSQLKNAVSVALADEDVDTILLNADTPGGSTEGLVDFSDFMKSASQQKRVVTQVDGLLASAGVWMTAFSDEIIAGRMDRIGSIGVRAAIVDSSERAEKEGIRVIPIDSGGFKSMGVPGLPVTDEQVAEMQKTVDGMFAEFKEVVMTGRNLSAEQFDAVGDGRTFFAPEAKELGLIDRVDTLQNTLARLTDKRPRMTVAEARARM